MNIAKVFNDAFPMLLHGLGITVFITLIALVTALVLGLLSCLMGLSRFFAPRLISKAYIWLIRGTPLIVQAFFIYFGFPQLVQAIGHSVMDAGAPGLIYAFGDALSNFRISAFTASYIALSLNAGAYISEIFRGGIQAVDKGQMEAARSLGLSHGRAMRRVILPQAFRISLPSLSNQAIISLKDSSIVSVISLNEIVNQAQIYIGRTMNSFGTWIIVGAMYLVVVAIITFASRKLEKMLDYDKRT